MVFVLIVVVGIVIFLNFYSRYIDKILYAERFSQMREVTEQLLPVLTTRSTPSSPLPKLGATIFIKALLWIMSGLSNT